MGDQTLSEGLADLYAERIRSGSLPPGARLPSVRAAASAHEVSPTTVVAAFDRLAARGLVAVEARRGFFVVGGGTRPAHRATSGLPHQASRLVRGLVQVTGRRSQPGLGSLPEEWLDVPAVGRCLRMAIAELGTGHGAYGDPGGDPALRAALVGRLAELGVRAGPDQVITTVGATHGLDIVASALLRPGDAVFVDDPGWSVGYARLEALGARLVPVPRLDDGPDLGVVERVLTTSSAADRPRLFVTSSLLHNPTSRSMRLPVAHRLLGLARDHDITIVEDDVYGYLAPAATPRLATLDGLERTVHVSGFSKILAPGWRIGFIAAPPSLVARLVDAKLMTSLATPSLLERAMAHCLDGGHLRRHADRIRRHLDEERPKVVALVRRHGWSFAWAPDGLFGWVDVGVDTEAVAALLAPAGWSIAPGALFDPHGKSSTRLRLNVATSSDPAFFAALHAAVTRVQGNPDEVGL